MLTFMWYVAGRKSHYPLFRGFVAHANVCRCIKFGGNINENNENSEKNNRVYRSRFHGIDDVSGDGFDGGPGGPG